MGFLEVLTLIFIVLKLMGTIDWSWLTVFSPMILAFCIYFLMLIGFIVVSVKSDKKLKRK